MALRTALVALALALVAPAGSLGAQSPVLVKDIWPGSAGQAYDPSESRSAGTSAGLAYYGATSTLHALGGLYVTDGTLPLRLVATGLAIESGGADLNGTFFFAASDGVAGTALWKTNGTPAGTVLVKRLSLRRIVGPLTAINGRLWFPADDGVHGDELWTSDGTEAGTVMVDATPGPLGTLDYASAIAGAGPNVFFSSCSPFSVNCGVASSLWRTDGTPAGTAPLANVSASSFAAVGPTLYFIGNGQELWKSDGTPPGTGKIADAPSGAELTAVGGTLFFSACDPTHGCELWKSDGTSPGTALVKDVTPGPAGTVHNLTAFGGALLFVASTDASAIALWRSDGTDGGTIPLASMTGQVLSSAVVGSKFFLLTDSQLWVSDGTATGTSVVVTFPLQATSGTGPIPDFRLMAVGNLAVFGLEDAVGGAGVYRSDGTAAGTRPLGPLATLENGSDPSYLTDANGTLFFVASDSAERRALWASNGTPETTRLLVDAGSIGSPLVPAGGFVFFFARPQATGAELWRSDGTPAGTVLVKDVAPGMGSAGLTLLGSRGDLVLFDAVTDPSGAAFLWRSDGTDAGTFDLGGVQAWSAFVEFHGASYFLGSYQGIYGLWRTDGTVLGTSAIAAIPGSNWGGIALAGDSIVFSTCDATHGCEPWRSDGTAAGTGLLLDVNPGVADSIFAGQGFFPVGSLAMFWADDGVHGREPWVTNGTGAGTRLLADIYPGPNSSTGSGAAAIGDLLLFTANDGTHGEELWKTDGTPAGTVLVRDINPGPASAFIVPSFTAGFRDVFFLASDGLTGEELWRSDGTARGTFRVADLFPGPGSSSASTIFRAFERCRRSGARVYFVADDGATGLELWSAPIATELYVLSPCRLLDTRAGGGAPLSDGDVRRFAAAGACGIPPGAAQIVANVTVVSPTAGGSVEVGPGGPTWTGLGTSSFATGRTRANNATVALGTDGSAAATLSAPGGSAHLVVDVTGYFR